MSHSHSNLPQRRHRERLWALWKWPVSMGVLSLVGLLAGLIADGWGDWVSWVGLGAPTAAMLWFGWLRRPAQDS